MLPAGQSRTVTFSFPIPLRDKTNKVYTTGSYYLFAMLDSFNQVGELLETNNNAAVPGPVNLRAPAQDYAVLKVDAPASAAVGELAPVYRVIKNVGNVPGTAVSYRYYASANAIVTQEDIPLSISLASGS